MGFNAHDAAQQVAQKKTNTAEDRVKQEALHISRILQPAASRNTTGPEATISRRIAGRLKKTLPSIQALESQLQGATDTKTQNQLKKQLAEVVEKFFADVASDWLDLRSQMANRTGAFKRLYNQLPKWFRATVESVRPFNLKNTTGNRPEPRFKGEVIPHHALPEIQREGLRPDGLDWIYTF